MDKEGIQLRLKENEQSYTIHKYMDYPKFLSLITTNSLYFARPEEFEDPLDSLFPEYTGIKNDVNLMDVLKKVNYDLIANACFGSILSNLKKIYLHTPSREQIYIVFENHLLPLVLKNTFIDDIDIFPKIQVKIWDIVDLYIANKQTQAINKLNDLLIEVQLKNMLDTKELNKKRALINCWHIGEYESVSMWKLYAKNDGIMIQTNVQKLLSLDFDKHVKQKATCVIDKVKYTDLVQRDKEMNELHIGSKGENANKDILRHYFEKNKSLQFEKELRIVIAENINSAKDLLNRKKGELISIKLPMVDFIEKIIVSPYTSNFYHKTLYDTLVKMNLENLANKIELSAVQQLQQQML